MKTTFGSGHARLALQVVLAAAPAFVSAGVAQESEAAALLAASWIAQAFILFGALFIVLAALGMLRFPDFYTRLHASTKLVTLGGIGILIGAGVAFAPTGAPNRVLLIGAFFLLTAPLSGYMIARSGYLSGVAPSREEGSVDEWQALGAAHDDVPEEERQIRQ